jgi:hypothetical protein
MTSLPERCGAIVQDGDRRNELAFVLQLQCVGTGRRKGVVMAVGRQAQERVLDCENSFG